MTATVSVDACELEHAIMVIRAAARDAAQQAVEVTLGIPLMNPELEVAIQVELRAVRNEMEHLARQLFVDAAVQEMRLVEFGMADGVSRLDVVGQLRRDIDSVPGSAGVGGAVQDIVDLRDLLPVAGDLLAHEVHNARVVATGLTELPAAVAHDFPDGQENFQVNFQQFAIGSLKPWTQTDYLTAGIGVGPIIGGQATISLSRSGDLYVTPGVNVGTPGLSFFAAAGHVNTPRRATRQQVDSYLSGGTVAAGGFVGVGGNAVFSSGADPGAQSGVETGFGTPQGQLSANYGFKLPLDKALPWWRRLRPSW
ncbi:MAG: hypothetical protein ACR2MY_10480 [Candidatus Dormibacteria bacterium]